MPTNFKQYIEWKGVKSRFTIVEDRDDRPDGFLDYEEDSSAQIEGDAGVFANPFADARALVPVLLYETL